MYHCSSHDVFSDNHVLISGTFILNLHHLPVMCLYGFFSASVWTLTAKKLFHMNSNTQHSTEYAKHLASEKIKIKSMMK